jgi:hypothetical protein
MVSELGRAFSLWQAPDPEKLRCPSPGAAQFGAFLAAVRPARKSKGESTKLELRLASQPAPPNLAGAFTTNNIDMSSSESSGAPAEATATTPAPSAEFPTFGSTRGSGLARGKRPSTGPAATTTAAASDYKPTAIEVVNAPREYTNPFAPVEEPAAAAPAPSAPVAVQAEAPIVITPAPVTIAAAPAPVEEPAQLNILPPAEQKTTAPQTWESNGFSPTRETRSERPRREERRDEPAADEPVDVASIPEKFLYVRPGVTFVPTPRNWGGAPRERRPEGESAPRAAEAPRREAPVAAAEAPKSGGFLGWLKGLFGGSSSAPAPVASASAEGESRRDGGHRRNRGGRSRGGPGGGEGGGQRRHRGGRGRSRSYGGESEGTRQGGI